MPKRTIPFVMPFQRVRVLPATLPQQLSEGKPGALTGIGTPTQANTFHRGWLNAPLGILTPIAIPIVDTVLPSAKTGFNKISDTIMAIGKWADVAAYASENCEIRLFFGGTEGLDCLATFDDQMSQAVDLPPMFVPASGVLSAPSAHQWTVWRQIPLFDRFFVPVLYNLTVNVVTRYRLHYRVYDAQL